DPQAGLDAFPVRITSISENDNNELTFEAEELPGITSVTPLYPAEQPGSSIPDFNTTPPNVNTPIIFEPNMPLSNEQSTVWIIATGLPPDWGGADVFVSTDGTTYAFIGILYAGAIQGVLTAGLPAYGGAPPDNTNTLSVN